MKASVLSVRFPSVVLSVYRLSVEETKGRAWFRFPPQTWGVAAPPDPPKSDDCVDGPGEMLLHRSSSTCVSVIRQLQITTRLANLSMAGKVRDPIIKIVSQDCILIGNTFNMSLLL